MSEEDPEPIDASELPPAGNSKGRIYPPIEEAEKKADADEDAADQPASGDASARREGEGEAAQRD